jgi:uncharacterized protein (TIGR00251 family)
MLHLTLKAHPGARDERVSLLPDGRLDVRVRAPALDGRANAAILAVVASALRLRPRQVRLLRGERSREKLVEVDLPDRAELSRRLNDAPAD